MTTIDLGKFKELIEDGVLPKIKIAAVGGAGAKVVSYMWLTRGMRDEEFQGVDLIVTDCHADTLILNKADTFIQLGKNLTKGLHSGGDSEIGQKAAEEARDVITQNLRGADVVLIVAGMGGGTGTGASPIVADCAKETGALTIAVVIKPFKFEGQRKMAQADAGIVKLKDRVDMLVTLSNESVLKNHKLTFKDISRDSFFKSDESIYRSVEAIVKTIIVPGLAQIDIKD